MKRVAVLGPALLWLCMQGCATFRVTTDYDPEATFSGLKTYAWMKPKKTQVSTDEQHNPLYRKRVVRAVNAFLQQRGYRLIQHGAPDFYVGYHTAVRQRIDVWSMNSLYAYPPGWGWNYCYRPGYAWSYSPHLITYNEGTLVLDIIDGKTRQLIWRGSYQARLSDRNRTPQQRQQAVTLAVQKILRHFPPTSKGK